MSNDELTKAVAEGVKTGIRTALSDPDLVEQFWASGYRHLTEHAGNGASQWVGKKILIAAATALLGWLIIYLAKNGGPHP